MKTLTQDEVRTAAKAALRFPAARVGRWAARGRLAVECAAMHLPSRMTREMFEGTVPSPASALAWASRRNPEYVTPEEMDAAYDALAAYYDRGGLASLFSTFRQDIVDDPAEVGRKLLSSLPAQSSESA